MKKILLILFVMIGSVFFFNCICGDCGCDSSSQASDFRLSFYRDSQDNPNALQEIVLVDSLGDTVDLAFHHWNENPYAQDSAMEFSTGDSFTIGRYTLFHSGGRSYSFVLDTLESADFFCMPKESWKSPYEYQDSIEFNGRLFYCYFGIQSCGCE